MTDWTHPEGLVVAAPAQPRVIAWRRHAWRVADEVLLLSVDVIAASALVLAAHAALQARVRTVLPEVESRSVYHQIVDDRPVPITVTAGWERVAHVATHDELLSDATLWRRMHVADWDAVPDPLRAAGLDAMLARFKPLLTTPSVWDRMTPHDWDLVPHPVRALAFRHMLQYWTSYYHVGDRYGLSRSLVADTAAAIVMSESWFEHRAENVNQWGNRDVGLAQASGFARRKLHELHAAGRSDAVFEDDEFYNPWVATRFVAIWLSYLLNELDGDLETAIRAYHRGDVRARKGEGGEYLEGVLRRRHVYIRNHSQSPAWRHLMNRDREITREAWPWLRARRVLRAPARPATAAWDSPGHDAPAWWRLALLRAPEL